MKNVACNFARSAFILIEFLFYWIAIAESETKEEIEKDWKWIKESLMPILGKRNEFFEDLFYTISL